MQRWVAGVVACLLVLAAAPSALSQHGGGGGGGGGPGVGGPGSGGPGAGGPGSGGGSGGGGGPGGGGPGAGSDHARFIQYDAETDELILRRGNAFERRVPRVDAERSLPTVVCSVCHADAVAQLKNSVHFTVQAPNKRVLFPGGGGHGALDRACGLPGTSAIVNYTSDVNLGECGKCHVGRFIPPMQDAFTSSFAQSFVALAGLDAATAHYNAVVNATAIVDGGLDCLICHAGHYKAVRDDVTEEDFEELATLEIAGYVEPGEDSPTPQGYGKAAHDNTDFDRDGWPDLLIDVDLDGVPDWPLSPGDLDGDGQPDPWPTVMQDRSIAAIQSVGKTDEHNCLRCHEHARTGYKRGTLFLSGYDAHAGVCFPQPSLSADDPDCPEHNTCTACHVTLDWDYDGDGLVDVHKFVRGHLVGGDLAAADYPPPPPGEPADPDDPTHLTCVQCHAPADLPETGDDGVHSERHLAVIACETCHITRSAGITYSVYGHGGHLSFSRNADGFDHNLITLDHMVHTEGDETDVAGDFGAFELSPVLMWFNGSTSFLAQSLAPRGAPNAQIAPFKPMANGMVMDGRFFDPPPTDELPTNTAGVTYNPHSMYRFFAEAADCDDLTLPGMEPFTCGSDGLYGNAEVFAALKLIGTLYDNFGEIAVQGMTPEEVRLSTLADFGLMDRPDKQTMAMMHVFPNLINFGKAVYGFEHYLVGSAFAGSPVDEDGDGVLDNSEAAFFAMGPTADNPIGGANAGLMAFMGFNGPMYLPADYQWYPMFTDASGPITMKLPDGKFMKLFLSMGLQQELTAMLPEDQHYLIPEMINGLVGNYPAFSNGVTLGGHGVVPEPSVNALGAGGKAGGGCLQCHTEDGVLDRPVPVTEEQVVELPGMGPAPLPVYRWTYYNYRALMELGINTENDDVVDGEASVDVGEDMEYVRRSGQQMVVNWFNPGTCSEDQVADLDSPVICYLPADAELALMGTGLDADDITWTAPECDDDVDDDDMEDEYARDDDDMDDEDERDDDDMDDEDERDDDDGSDDYADDGDHGDDSDCDLPAWMPVLEPVLTTAPNYAVLGYAKEEVVWSPDDPRISPDTPVIDVVIDEAEWESKNRRVGELEVEGSAPNIDRFEIVNPATGEVLIRVRVDEDDGSFEAERRIRLAQAPCTVAARVDGVTGAPVAVDDAPDECVGEQVVAER